MNKAVIIILFILVVMPVSVLAAYTYTYNNMSVLPATSQDTGASWAGMKFEMNVDASQIEVIKAPGVTLEEVRLYNSTKGLLLTVTDGNTSVNVTYNYTAGTAYYMGLASTNPTVNKGRYTAAGGLYPAARTSFNWTGSFDTSDDSITQWNSFEAFTVRTGSEGPPPPPFNTSAYNVTFPYVDNAVTSNNNLTINFTTTDAYYNYTRYTLIKYQNTLENGLIAYYPFEEASGTNATDIKGLHNLTLVGTLDSIPCIKGSCRNYTGDVNNYFVSSSWDGLLNFSTNKSFTFNVWANFQDTVSVMRVWGGGGGGSWDGDNRQTWFGGGYNVGWGEGTRLSYGSCTGTLCTETIPTANLSSGWNMYTLTKNSAINDSHVLLYVNGVLYNTLETAEVWDIYGDEFIVGARRNLPTIIEPMTGYIDELGIWNRSLTSAELQTLYGLIITNTTNINTVDTSHTFINLPDGKYYYGLTIYDNYSNSQFYDPNVTIDTTTPVINFTTGTSPNGSYIDGLKNIFVNVSVTEENINTTTIRLYDAAGTLINTTSSNTTILSANYTDLDNGVYYYNATATDLAGNSGSTPTWQVTIISNFTIANYTVTVKYGPGTYTADTTYYMIGNTTDPYFDHWNITTTANGITPNYCYQESANNINQTGIDGSCGLNYTGSVISDGGPGCANINDGNWATTIGSDSRCNITYVKPINSLSTSIWEVKSGGVIQNLTIPTSCWTKNSSYLFLRVFYQIGTGAAYWYCSNDTGLQTLFQNVGAPAEEAMLWNTLSIGTNTTISTLPNTRIDYSGLADGIVYSNITATDLALNTYLWQNYWTIDTIPPTISYTTGTTPNGSYIDGARNIFINITANDTNINYTIIKLYDAAGILLNNTMTNTSGILSANYTSLPDGIYYYNATVTDLVGYTTNTVTYMATIIGSFQIANYTVTVKYGPGTYTNDTTYYIIANTTDTYFKNWTFTLNNQTNISTVPNTRIDYTGLIDGVQYNNITAIDQALNTYLWQNNYTIDTTIPSIYFSNNTPLNGTVIEDASTFTINITVSDTNLNYSIIYLYNTTGLVTTTNTTTLTYTSVGNEIYYFNATAGDLAGNINNTETRQILIDYYKNNITLTGYERTTNATIPFDVYFLGQQNTTNYIVNDGTYSYGNPDNAFDENTGTYALAQASSVTTFDAQLGKIFNQSTYVNGIYWNVRGQTLDGGINNIAAGYLETYDGAIWTTVQTIYYVGPSSSGVDSGIVSGTYTFNGFTKGVRIRAVGSSSGALQTKYSWIYELVPNTTYRGQTYYNFSVTNRTLVVNMAKGNGTYDIIMNTTYGTGYNTCITNNWAATSNYIFSCVFSNNILNIIASNAYSGAQITNFTINITLGNYTETQTANTTNITLYLIQGQTYTLTFSHPSYFTNTISYTPSNNTETLNQTMNQTTITFRFRHVFDNAIISNANITMTDTVTGNTYNTSTGILVFSPSAGYHNFTITSPRYIPKTYTTTFNPLDILITDILLSPILNVSIYEEKLSAVTLTYFNLSHPQYIRYTIYCLNDAGEQISTITEIIPNTTISGAYALNTTCRFEKIRFDLQYINLEGVLNLYNRILILPATVNQFNFNIFLPDLAQGYAILETFLKPYDIFGIYTTEANTQVQIHKLMPTGTELITSDYVDAEGKITAYLIQGDQYIITILADNQPARILGPYSANTEGTKILRLFDITASPTANSTDTTVITSTTITPVAGEEENHSLITGYYQDTGNYTQTLTLTIYNGTCENKKNVLVTDTLDYTELNTSLFTAAITYNQYGSRYMNLSRTEPYLEFCVEFNRTYMDGTKATNTNNVRHDSWIYIPAQFENEWTFPWIIMLVLIIIALALNARTVSFGSLFIMGLALILYGWNWLSTGTAAPGAVITIPVAIALLIAIFMNIKKTMNQ